MADGAVAALHRFPVKGLSPERLRQVELETGAYVPGDRLLAFENGPSGYDEAAPRHLPKAVFLMLMRDERLAKLKTAYWDGHLKVRLEGRDACEGDTRTPEGRAALESFMAGFCAEALKGAPRLREAGAGFRFTDSRSGYVSLLNLASVAALEQAIGRPVDPLRFRANIAFAGPPAWNENDWVGRQLRIGGVRLAVTSTTERCAATEVDPTTGARDMRVVRTLVKRFGHNLCGVYCSVLEGGLVREGDPLELL